MGKPLKIHVATAKIGDFILKVSVYGMKGKRLWETSENLRPARGKIAIFKLKVSVYGMKGRCLY